MTKICEKCISKSSGLTMSEDGDSIEPITYCKNLKFRKKHGVGNHRKVIIGFDKAECEFFKAKKDA